MNLKTCPNSPNCISSQTVKTDSHYEPAILFRNSDTTQIVYDRLIKTVELMESMTLESNQGNKYLSISSKTKLGFIDDIDFLIDETEKVIHLRSASRLGYYDFGKNRSRMTEFKSLYDKQP